MGLLCCNKHKNIKTQNMNLIKAIQLNNEAIPFRLMENLASSHGTNNVYKTLIEFYKRRNWISF